MREALSVKEKILGADHPDTALTMNNLGVIVQKQGRSQEARALFELALGHLEARLGTDHPRTRMVRGNLAAVSG